MDISTSVISLFGCIIETLEILEKTPLSVTINNVQNLDISIFVQKNIKTRTIMNTFYSIENIDIEKL